MTLTDAQLRDQAVAELAQTTVGRINSKWKTPPAGTHWANAEALLAQIGQASPVPPPLTSKVRAIYAAGNQASEWEAIRAQGFNTLVTGYDTPLLKQIAADGCKAWVSVGYWDDSKGAFSLTDDQAVAAAKPAWATGAVSSWYVADEPSKNPAAIKARSALLRAACPGSTTIMTTWDPGVVAQFAHVTDYVALDGYPNRGGFSPSVIPAQAAAADKAGWPYFGVIGAFGSSAKGATYVLPTVAQLQSMIDQWNATKQIGYAAYCWGAEVSVSNPADYIENHPELLAVLKAANAA